jgi:hypothetical protein
MATGFGALMLIRKLGRELASIRDIIQETPDMFTQETVERAESLQLALERSSETLKQFKVQAFEKVFNFLERQWWSGLNPAVVGGGGTSQKTQLEEVGRLEDRLKTVTERRKKVDAELAKIATAKERADRRIRDLVLEQLEPAEQLAMLQREQAESAEALLKHSEGTKEFYEAKETLADKALQVLTKMAEIEADRTKEEKEQLAVLKPQEETARRLASAHESIADAQEAQRRAFGDRSRVSLQEAAAGPAMNRYAAEARAMAQMVLAMEDRAKLARFHGRGAFADELTNRALAVRNRLEPVLQSSESDPMAAVRNAVQASAKALQALLDQAQTRGIVVQPRNGP